MLRFREARDAGAIPFSVQGPENALCLDGGRTLGWEIADRITRGHADVAHAGRWRAFVQVGGGAFAASVGAGLGPTSSCSRSRPRGARRSPPHGSACPRSTGPSGTGRT
jgi:hypothetical protein